ncbi:hypothetical protein XBI1_780012 [Xenorhabdus bovienii str. Intermedium]|uniref:Uncharacterized protein n=1 Tax=Xenorhabdus bovienii str. Intermedium TaxID=1379677 RepID=A0A077QR73_XENBV|nr:hypothetical protein XBI1_780012 [Xenorhabdus bovienii str. Intermedium]
MAVSSGCGTEVKESLGLSMKKQPSENNYQSGEKPKKLAVTKSTTEHSLHCGR